MKPVQLKPADLTEWLLSGDPTKVNRALKQLYMSPIVNGKVKDWANLYGLKEKEPDDVIQEAIMLFYDLVLEGKFRGEGKPSTFLLGICKNIIRDSGKKVSRVYFKETLTDADLKNEEQLADALVGEEETQLERSRDEELRSAMGQLTENCQQALKLYYFENKSMAQVAEARKLSSAQQAKKAVHRCRESLRKILNNNPKLKNILTQLS